MDTKTLNNSNPKKQTSRRSRGRKGQANPAPQHAPTANTPPKKILSRNNKPINVPTSQEPTAPVSTHQYTLTEALDDVLIRFILNCPEEEHESMDRMFFQLEEAHWFYEDFYRENCKTLPELKFKEFVEKIFSHCPLLAPYRSKVDAHTQSFYQYKTSVPVCGAIILNETLDKVLLVKGWSNKSSWSFPRGKINKDEPQLQCAIREVFEETGFDISQHGANDKDFVEMVMGEQKIKLFIVSGISEDTVFVPQTRKEISATEWHTFDKILERSPTTQKTSGKYWPVIPFVRKLKRWIAQNKKRLLGGGRRGGKKQSPTSSPQQVRKEDMMSISPPRAVFKQEPSPAIAPMPQPMQYAPYSQYPYGYHMYNYYPTAIQQQPPLTAMMTGASDSLLSFSFNMNEIFEDSAIQNVVA